MNCKLKPLNRSLVAQIIKFDDIDERYVLKNMRTKGCDSFLLLNKHGTVLGYIIYYTYRKYAKIERVAVKKRYRRQGYGSLIIRSLKEIAYELKLNSIVSNVPDTNLGMHLFLKANDFVATAIQGSNYLFEYENVQTNKKNRRA